MANAGRPARPGTWSTSPLVGRERELELLRDAFWQASIGHGRLVLVSGEAGIGKTSLVQEFTREALEHDVTILRGYCYDLVTTPPYGLWLELTDRYPPRDDMPELPNALKRGTGTGDLPNQMALFEVARDFLESLAHERPLVIVLEDVHWADQASLDLLRYVAQRVEDQSTLLIVTYRDDEVVLPGEYNVRFPLNDVPPLLDEARPLSGVLLPVRPFDVVRDEVLGIDSFRLHPRLIEKPDG
jgi:predicted ATPase